MNKTKKIAFVIIYVLLAATAIEFNLNTDIKYSSASFALGVFSTMFTVMSATMLIITKVEKHSTQIKRLLTLPFRKLIAYAFTGQSPKPTKKIILLIKLGILSIAMFTIFKEHTLSNIYLFSLASGTTALFFISATIFAIEKLEEKLESVILKNEKSNETSRLERFHELKIIDSNNSKENRIQKLRIKKNSDMKRAVVRSVIFIFVACYTVLVMNTLDHNNLLPSQSQIIEYILVAPFLIVAKIANAINWLLESRLYIIPAFLIAYFSIVFLLLKKK
ncbi:hypothetical protein [Pseudomonas fluorescens]